MGYIAHETAFLPSQAINLPLVSNFSFPLDKSRTIIHRPEPEPKDLPDTESEAQKRLQYLAIMCGGWSWARKPNYEDEGPTLRQYCIV